MNTWQARDFHRRQMESIIRHRARDEAEAARARRDAHTIVFAVGVKTLAALIKLTRFAPLTDREIQIYAKQHNAHRKVLAAFNSSLPPTTKDLVLLAAYRLAQVVQRKFNDDHN